MDAFRQQIIQEAFPICCKQCDNKKNWIKPGTILFGEQMPIEYFKYSSSEGEWDDVDLLIIAGTSLRVAPSNQLPEEAKMSNKNIVRLLANREIVQSYDYKWNQEHSNDIFCQGDCDDTFLTLAKMLKWDQELFALIENTHCNDDNDTNVNKITNQDDKKNIENMNTLDNDNDNNNNNANQNDKKDIENMNTLDKNNDNNHNDTNKKDVTETKTDD